MAAEDIHTYCPMCIAQCGVVATVEDGRFTKLKPDSDHPNAGICIKGYAAPQIVYSPDRLLRPLKRTRPKGDPDPGWVEISWDEALETVAAQLLAIREKFGAEAVVFTRSTPAGSASSDYEAWCIRLANAFGSPNLLATTHICTWNVMVGSKHTFGTPMPAPDYENTRCILLWGANPRATFATSMKRIMEARNRGAKLIVIDPRGHRLAQEADCWLRVRPGSDGALALAMTHVLIEEELYDSDFVRDWTNAPLLVRSETGRLMAARDLWPEEAADAFVVWGGAGPVAYRPGQGYARAGIRPAVDGRFACRLGDGTSVECHPVFALLAERAKEQAPELSEQITWVPAADVRRAARLFAGERPSCLFSWAGLEMHTNAMQTNRAVSCFYALTGQYDARGSNLLNAMTPSRPPAAPHLLPKEKAARRLGLAEHPLGPPADPGSITAGLFYDAALAEKPYPVKALVAFGGDALLAHADGARGQQALAALDFYVQMDLFANPTASFADILLPAATPWESEALKTSFGGKGGTEQAARWAQLRKALVPPAGEARSDLRVIFDLAQRMGLGAHFFNGDIEAGWRDQLEPSGLTLDALRVSPVGLEAKIETQPKKYASLDPASRQPRGFPTPTRRIELYSARFAAAGYDPLPRHEEPVESPIAVSSAPREFPLVLTSFRLQNYVDEQHRNIPLLREAAPEPVIEIHPDTAAGAGIADGDWVHLETGLGKVTLKARFSAALHPNVVCAVYGWWQGCKTLGLPGYDALSFAGANMNRIIPNAAIDPISASVPHRSRMCRVSRAGA